MISGFVVYRCHGNIDFSKLSITTNFSLCPVCGEILRRSDGGKSTKMSFENVRYGSQKTVSNHLNAENELIETKKSLQKDGHGKLVVRRNTKLLKAGKVRRQYRIILAFLS